MSQKRKKPAPNHLKRIGIAILSVGPVIAVLNDMVDFVLKLRDLI